MGLLDEIQMLSRHYQGLLGGVEANKNNSLLGVNQGEYGFRIDGTKKDKGWLGEIRMPDGVSVMTEMSIGEPNSNETFRPAITPNMHPAVLNYMRQTGEVPMDAVFTSDSFANKRIKAGQSPFFNSQSKKAK
jgi:hypothetical protein